jgi:hypothetical protein
MTTIDHINIENNSRNDDLVSNNFILFEEIVLKKGYKERYLTYTENRHFHRYIEPDKYDPKNENYTLDYQTVENNVKGYFDGYTKVLDHPRKYLTSDGKKVQVCSLYRSDVDEKHDMLMNDGWVVIQPIYSTQARTYMRFVNIVIRRLQIKEDILNMKIAYYKDQYMEGNSMETSEKIIQIEQNQKMVIKTYAQLEDVRRRIYLMKADDEQTDISRLLIIV